MTAKIYYDKDTSLEPLKGKHIGIVGYGSQGHAHALNLKDSGLDVRVGLRKDSKSNAKAQAAGLKTDTVDKVAEWADIIMMLAPDVAQRDIYDKEIKQHMKKGKTIMFSHGFNIHFKQIVPPPDVDVSMIAPKAPGHRVREVFTEGSGVPMLIAIHQDASGHAKENALAYAKGTGGTRAGVLETTFKEETETDLFGEQVVLCGGVTSLVKNAFETLVKAGYQPEVAYFECMHELKLIVDLMYQGGMNYMRYSISDTAEYGDYTRGPRIVDANVRKSMEKILSEIQDGSFAKEFITEIREGGTNFLAMREKEKKHQIEQVGSDLRGMMSFIEKPKDRGAY